MYGKAEKPRFEAPSKTHVKKGDTVRILTGKDRGKQARVLKVHPTKGTAIVERINLAKKHTRPNPQKNVAGGILEKESPIRLANLQVVCPSCNQPARTGSHRTAEGGKRFCRKCDTEM